VTRTHENFVIIDEFLGFTQGKKVVFSKLHGFCQILARKDLGPKSGGPRETGSKPNDEFSDLNQAGPLFRKVFRDVGMEPLNHFPVISPVKKGALLRGIVGIKRFKKNKGIS
jgi:hypothetical protein